MDDDTAQAVHTQNPDHPVRGREAAARVDQAQHLAVHLPVLGAVRLPRPEQLAYYGAVGILVALEVIEWPLAVVLATGHALAQQQHSRAIQLLGEGLEDA